MQKILIVEDEAFYTKLIRDKLDKIGYQIIEAKSGQEGLRLAKQEHPDLIIADIKMPGMDGIQMLDALRRDAYGSHVKVIFLSNLEADDAIVKKFIEDKPSFYLKKDNVSLTELLEKIKTLLN